MLDLVEILKNCPKGTKLYSTIHGEVTLNYVSDERVSYPIRVSQRDGLASFTQNGRFYTTSGGECILFPSKDQRDWSKFDPLNTKVVKFEYSSLKPFDRMLVRNFNDNKWRTSYFSYMNGQHLMCDTCWYQGIPYNDETKHLVGTTYRPDEKYIWWEE